MCRVFFCDIMVSSCVFLLNTESFSHEIWAFSQWEMTHRLPRSLGSNSISLPMSFCWLWILDDNGWLWMNVDDNGWLWMVVDDYGWVWMIMRDNGWLWRLWMIMDYCGWLWMIMVINYYCTTTIGWFWTNPMCGSSLSTLKWALRKNGGLQQ